MSRALGSPSSNGNGGVVLLVVAGAAVAAAFVLYAVVLIFSTPYPYIALGVALGGYGTYAAIKRYRRERMEKAFHDALARIARQESTASTARALLERAPEQADALLLLAADSAARGDHRGALELLDRAARPPETLGNLGAGLALRFPGLPSPIWVPQGGFAGSYLACVRAHLLALDGRATEAVAQLAMPAGDPAYATAQLILANLRVRTEDWDGAIEALGAATEHSAHDPAVNRLARYHRARVFEHRGLVATALAEYSALLAHGPFADTEVRRSALEARQAEVLRIQAERDADERAAALHRAAVANDEAVLLRTLVRMEAGRGPATRRNALDAGLAALELPETRDRLLLLASKVEVAAVLDKVDGLKTAAAKRRHLEAALEAIRSDPVPDELQTDQIRLLEQALAELG